MEIVYNLSLGKEKNINITIDMTSSRVHINVQMRKF